MGLLLLDHVEGHHLTTAGGGSTDWAGFSPFAIGLFGVLVDRHSCDALALVAGSDATVEGLPTANVERYSIPHLPEPEPT